jgi:hypothetical protein
VLAHQPAPTFLHGDGAHAPPSRCRATVLRPEITDHYRSDNASEPASSARSGPQASRSQPRPPSPRS